MVGSIGEEFCAGAAREGIERGTASVSLGEDDLVEERYARVAGVGFGGFALVDKFVEPYIIMIVSEIA